MSDETNPAPVVLLVNRTLPYNCVGKVTGSSGVEYGYSSFEEAHGAHVCRMTLDQWRACKSDVTLGAARIYAQWEVDIELPESPTGGEDVMGRIRDADGNKLDAIVCGLHPIVRAVYAKAKEIAALPAPVLPLSTFAESKSPQAPHIPAPRPGEHTAESLALLRNWYSLTKIADKFGVDHGKIHSAPELRAAILAAQAGGATAPGTPAAGLKEPNRMFDIPDPKPGKEAAFAGGKTT